MDLDLGAVFHRVGHSQPLGQDLLYIRVFGNTPLSQFKARGEGPPLWGEHTCDWEDWAGVWACVSLSPTLLRMEPVAVGFKLLWKHGRPDEVET